VQYLGLDTGSQSFCYSFIALSIVCEVSPEICCSGVSRYSGVSVQLQIFSADWPTSGSGQDWVYRRRYGFTMPLSPLLYGSETRTLLKADERRLEAFHMNCQRRILGIRCFHFVMNASVTSQTGEEGLAIRICRRRLSGSDTSPLRTTPGCGHSCRR